MTIYYYRQNFLNLINMSDTKYDELTEKTKINNLKQIK